MNLREWLADTVAELRFWLDEMAGAVRRSIAAIGNVIADLACWLWHDTAATTKLITATVVAAVVLNLPLSYNGAIWRLAKTAKQQIDCQGDFRRDAGTVDDLRNPEASFRRSAERFADCRHNVDTRIGNIAFAQQQYRREQRQGP